MLARVLIALVVVLFAAASAASYVIEYAWWHEMGQVDTWLSRWIYSAVPLAAATLVAAVIFWMAIGRGLIAAGTRYRENRVFARLATAAAVILAWLASSSTLNTWTTVRYFGTRGLAAAEWSDPVFGKPLGFYLFDLPFYNDARAWFVAVAILAAILHAAVANGWALRNQIGEFGQGANIQINPADLVRAPFVRASIAIFFLGLAVRYWLGRYEMVYNEHSFLTGVDYTDEHFALPLQWAAVGASIAAAAAAFAGRWPLLLILPAALILKTAVPAAVGSFYVRPNEISLEKPYIERHLAATRRAYGLDRRVKEVEFKANPDARIDTVKHKNLLDNVRLWDLGAFHDTVTQIQALRPYYKFQDSDVDRYIIDGQIRQVLLSPRELDITQLPDARTRWINPHFIYTHGYGLVLAEVARIAADGYPELLIKNAPPEIKPKSLKISRPEIYYGEVVHEPVFVRTAQAEFNYPSGDANVSSKYEGLGGFPITSLPMRIAAALSQGEMNILLTGYLTGESRMMIRRDVKKRVEALAEFIDWDADPYLVITEEGRLVWILDGYTSSNAHPYSQRVRSESLGRINYIRNSVKATVDAYDGTTRLYVFEPDDPLIQAWQRVFPKLFQPAASMPAGLRAHVRYPEALFRVQAEIWRTFHMKDPQAFYNKEDLWDIARYGKSGGESASTASPTYIVATLPGSDKPEFLLLLPFTPRSKDNLIGLMIARCDGESLGELLMFEMSKQELIYGPMQIAARINQDQNISKDLTLWNQQGSQVLRGQTLVLPIDDTILYVEPIYIQSTQARMPQLKKVVLAQGNSLIYADTYPDALAQLSGQARQAATEAIAAAAAPAPTSAAAAPAASVDPRISRIRQHLQRYRELTSQGKLAEAGRELEAIEREAAQR